MKFIFQKLMDSTRTGSDDEFGRGKSCDSPVPGLNINQAVDGERINVVPVLIVPAETRIRKPYRLL